MEASDFYKVILFYVWQLTQRYHKKEIPEDREYPKIGGGKRHAFQYICLRCYRRCFVDRLYVLYNSEIIKGNKDYKI